MPIVAASYALRDARGEFLRHELQHQKRQPCGIERQRVVEQFARRLRGFALAALLRLMLQFEADMAADRKALRGKRSHEFGARALEFHAVRAGMAQRSCAFQRLRGRDIGRVRKITDDVSRRRPAPHGGDVMGHVGERHLALMRIAQHICADAVADENNVDARLGLDPCGRRVISGEHDDFLAAPLHLEEMGGS